VRHSGGHALLESLLFASSKLQLEGLATEILEKSNDIRVRKAQTEGKFLSAGKVCKQLPAGFEWRAFS